MRGRGERDHASSAWSVAWSVAWNGSWSVTWDAIRSLASDRVGGVAAGEALGTSQVAVRAVVFVC